MTTMVAYSDDGNYKLCIREIDGKETLCVLDAKNNTVVSSFSLERISNYFKYIY